MNDVIYTIRIKIKELTKVENYYRRYNQNYIADRYRRKIEQHEEAILILKAGNKQVT